ncbi:acyltransferase [Bradyrhizobium sp. JR3.5]
MNLDYYLQRLVRRATCRLGADTKLMRTARIRNTRGDSDRIVIGDNSVIRGELMTFAHGGEIKIGEWCYIGEGTRIWSAASIEIGNRVLISHSANGLRQSHASIAGGGTASSGPADLHARASERCLA